MTRAATGVEPTLIAQLRPLLELLEAGTPVRLRRTLDDDGISMVLEVDGEDEPRDATEALEAAKAGAVTLAMESHARLLRGGSRLVYRLVLATGASEGHAGSP